MHKVTPFLWFDNKAEEAAKFYVSIFKNAKLLSPTTFQIDGQEFIAFNGGPHFTFTPAISLFVNCETQEEIDELWEKLSEGGEKSRCGWVPASPANPNKSAAIVHSCWRRAPFQRWR